MKVNIYAEVESKNDDTPLIIYRGADSNVVTLKFMQGAVTVDANEIEKVLARFKRFDNEEKNNG